MSAKNLCKRCALSGTAACPPGYVRNSVSTSEGVIQCSRFEPKPVVPRRELPKKYTYRSELEAAQARCAELCDERALWRSAHDALLVENERLKVKLAGESNSRRGLLKENAQLHEKRMDALRARDKAYKKLETKCKDFSYLQEKWTKACAERNEARAELEKARESSPQRSDALLLRKLNRIQAERDTARQQRDLAIRDREKSSHRLQRIIKRNANYFALLQEARAERDAAWENRNRFCAALGEIGDLLLGSRDAHAPDAVVRAVRNLEKERKTYEEQLAGYHSRNAKNCIERDEALRELARLREQHKEQLAELGKSIRRRQPHCDAVWDIGQLILGKGLASYEPATVMSAVRKLCGERNALREERNRLQVECLKRGNERDTLREERDELRVECFQRGNELDALRDALREEFKEERERERDSIISPL